MPYLGALCNTTLNYSMLAMLATGMRYAVCGMRMDNLLISQLPSDEVIRTVWGFLYRGPL